MKAGVSSVPCAVRSTPRRAPASVWVRRNSKHPSVMRTTTTVYNPVTPRMRLPLVSAVIGLLLAATILAQPARFGLSESARLAAVYGEILNARFAPARALLASSCPPAPREACLALKGAVQWWQVILDPEDRSLDASLETAARSAI